ncbi:hypothetical protein JL722_9426 [Aureococcus anophagefferens]|nr:hypothetical protein JL722_9426 [Aureococcus anophagefferens]
MPENAAFEAVATPRDRCRVAFVSDPAFAAARHLVGAAAKRDADRAAAFADRAARDAACLRKEAKRRRRVRWVKNMASLCNSSASFDGDIGAWDVSKVTTLQGAFQGCASFNQDLSAWDVSKVTTLRGAFTDAAAFNEPLGRFDVFGAFVAWDVSSVTTLQGAFLGCASFNQDLSAWDVSKVTTLRGAFSDAAAFDQNIGAWDVSSVTTLQGAFQGAASFDEDLGDWDVSKVTTLRRTFEGAAEFDAPIGDWDVSKVTVMYEMFYNAAAFDQPIGDWDVSQVTTMVSTFEGAAAFDADIGDWDVSQVTVMDYMFLGADEFIQCVNWVTPANSFGVGGDPWHPDLQCYPFDNRNNLENAVDEWLDDSGDAQTKYGPISRWDTSRVTDMATLFQETASFDEPIGGWDTSKVTDMSFTFDAAAAFDQDIGAWDVSSVTDMYETFDGATIFNQDIGGWDTSKLTDMGFTFGETAAFDQDISAWDVSSVTSMYAAFYGAAAFNTPIGGWEVSQVTNMVSTFQGAAAFDADIGNWDVSKVPDMSYLFSGAAAFDADIGNWDVSQVTSMYTMFWDAATFNQDIGEWDVSRVTDMYETFYNATAFNAAIGGWDVSQVSTMRGMFYDAVAFNALIGDWHVSKVTNMREMFFNAAAFDADIGDWDTSAVTNMYAAFADASAFNQPIGDWDVSPTTAKTDMFLNADAFDQCLPWYAEFTCNPTPAPSSVSPTPAPSPAPSVSPTPAPSVSPTPAPRFSGMDAATAANNSAVFEAGLADAAGVGADAVDVEFLSEDAVSRRRRLDEAAFTLRYAIAVAPANAESVTADLADAEHVLERILAAAVAADLEAAFEDLAVPAPSAAPSAAPVAAAPPRRADGRAAAPAAAPVALRVVPEAVENADAVNPSAELVLAAVVETPHGALADVVWSGPFRDADLLTPAAQRVDAGLVYLVVRAGVLAPGEAYEFELVATSGGDAGAATIAVTTNAPPRSGRLAVAPAAGVALLTEFALSLDGWVDDQLPLAYAFYHRLPGETAATQIAASSEAAAAARLPRGGGGGGVRVVVGEVSDALGAAARVGENATVAASDLGVEALDPVVEELLDESLGAADPDYGGALATAVAATGEIAPCGDAARRGGGGPPGDLVLRRRRQLLVRRGAAGALPRDDGGGDARRGVAAAASGGVANATCSSATAATCLRYVSGDDWDADACVVVESGDDATVCACAADAAAADYAAASSQESYARYLRTVFRRPLDGDLLTTGRPLFRVFLGLATFWALAGLAGARLDRRDAAAAAAKPRPSEARRRSSAVLGRGASKHLETLEAHLSGDDASRDAAAAAHFKSLKAALPHAIAKGSYFRKTARQSFAARWPLLSLCRETLRRHHDWVSIYDAYDAARPRLASCENVRSFRSFGTGGMCEWDASYDEPCVFREPSGGEETVLDLQVTLLGLAIALPLIALVNWAVETYVFAPTGDGGDDGGDVDALADAGARLLDALGVDAAVDLGDADAVARAALPAATRVVLRQREELRVGAALEAAHWGGALTALDGPAVQYRALCQLRYAHELAAFDAGIAHALYLEHGARGGADAAGRGGRRRRRRGPARANRAFARSARRGAADRVAAAAKHGAWRPPLGTALGLGGLAAFFLLHEEVQAILFEEAANLAAHYVILAALFVVRGRGDLALVAVLVVVFGLLVYVCLPSLRNRDPLVSRVSSVDDAAREAALAARDGGGDEDAVAAGTLAESDDEDAARESTALEKFAESDDEDAALKEAIAAHEEDTLARFAESDAGDDEPLRSLPSRKPSRLEALFDDDAGGDEPLRSLPSREPSRLEGLFDDDAGDDEPLRSLPPSDVRRRRAPSDDDALVAQRTGTARGAMSSLIAMFTATGGDDDTDDDRAAPRESVRRRRAPSDDDALVAQRTGTAPGAVSSLIAIFTGGDDDAEPECIRAAPSAG